MRYLLVFSILIVIGCSVDRTPVADLVIQGAQIVTINQAQPHAEAIAIRGGIILAVGSDDEIEKYRGSGTQVIDGNQNFVMPGFIESHGHFSGLGTSLQNLNFLRSRSWEEIVTMVGEKVLDSDKGDWIIGRGWHQEKWVRVPEKNIHGYPFHDELSEVSPDNPVLLFHASGHAAFANRAAMEASGINRETASPAGGEIVRDQSGDAIGVFEERAQNLIRRAYQEYLDGLTEEEKSKMWYEGIELATTECLMKGITSFQDAGSSLEWIDRYKGLAEEGKLDLRLWIMIRHSAEYLRDKLASFPWIGVGGNWLTVRSIKSEVDGALGSFGAWLLEPYADRPGFIGQNTTEVSQVAAIAELAYKHSLQLCVHAIGDRANKEVLDIYESKYGQNANQDLRWRIEHAQHLDTTDIPRFGQMGVIAAMQGIHCTSDAPFVERRLGPARSKYGAYPWKSLHRTGAVICNGTDAPVEDVDPIESFYATVSRKRADNGFEFYPEQALTREEALHSYTLAGAYAAFEEDIKGSLEVGKLADIVILSNNLLTCSEENILETEVLMTIVDGEVKFQREEIK
ncbi:MAG: amidohydrolase [Saprospiraceae bacterium]|nr:amidohydrolase [Saprospiraceae bacterium]